MRTLNRMQLGLSSRVPAPTPILTAPCNSGSSFVARLWAPACRRALRQHEIRLKVFLGLARLASGTGALEDIERRPREQRASHRSPLPYVGI